MRGFLGRVRAKKSARKLKLEMFLLRKAALQKLRASMIITKCIRKLIQMKQEHADDPYKSHQSSKFISRTLNNNSRKDKRKKFTRDGPKKAGILRQVNCFAFTVCLCAFVCIWVMFVCVCT